MNGTKISVKFQTVYEVQLRRLTVQAKNYQIKKEKLLLMKYQHVADIVVKFYSCATCVKWVWEVVERHYNPSLFKKYGAEKSLSWKVSNLQLLKNLTLSVFELKDWYMYQNKPNFAIYKVTQSFFSIFELWKKLRRAEFQFFKQKFIFLKKMYNSKT